MIVRVAPGCQKRMEEGGRKIPFPPPRRTEGSHCSPKIFGQPSGKGGKERERRKSWPSLSVSRGGEGKGMKRPGLPSATEKRKREEERVP